MFELLSTRKMTDLEPPAHSFDICSESELYPKKNPLCDEEGLMVPFPTLHGESVEYLGRVTEGVIALSNYRLLIKAKKWFVNIPIGLIDSVDMREIFYVIISCKDATTIKCSFLTNEWCQVWYKRLAEKTSTLRDLNQVFALSYHAWLTDDNASGSQSSTSQTGQFQMLCQISEDINIDMFGKEIERMKFDTSVNKVWRMSHINENFSVSPSYPKIHIVPTSISDEKLISVASFRSMRRFPSVVWRSQRNGAVIVRCSQPELGWLGWRNSDDEMLLSAIPQACALNPGTDNKPESGQNSPELNGEESISLSPKKMLLIDCRSYGAAFANRAKGGGCESADYYPCCEIQFMNLANIHSIRKSFIALRTLTSSFTEQVNWLSCLENTKWLHYIGAILRAANLVVNAVDKEGRPVLVHCSDGWDRTPQIVALAQLLLDPYYRKIEGFQALVEREWIQFGHKFADRCGHALDSEDANERSPVFLQWLDCVFQVYRQFPCAFEFNEAYLIKLVHHTYSRLFGTFMFNTSRERCTENLLKRTTSIWSLLHPSNTKFHNLLYNEVAEQQVLYPEFSVNKLVLWNSVYLSNSSLSTKTTEDFPTALETGEITPDIEMNGLQKTRSCENLAMIQEHTPLISRRLSDPNILHGSTEQIVTACKELDTGQKVMDQENGSLVMDQENGGSLVENGTEESDDNELISQMNGILTNGAHMNGSVTNGANDSDCERENSDSEDNTVTENLVTENGVEESLKEETSNTTLTSNGDLSNGHMETELEEDNKMNGNCDSITNDSKTFHQSVESSTDTITDEEFLERHTDNNLQNGINYMNGHSSLTNGYSNGHVINDHNSVQTTAYSLKEKLRISNSTMSTSTSDISDSRVVGLIKSDCDHRLHDLKLSTPYCYTNFTPSKFNCVGGSLYSKPNSASPSPSSSSPFPTPSNSRTPNSTCPPTPDTTTKSVDWAINRQSNGMGRHLDCDGLTTYIDPIQQRMQQKEIEYERKLAEVKDMYSRKICGLEKLLHANGRLECREEPEVLYSDIEGELCSLGNLSNPASDVSWENLEVKDCPLTLWIPDHAVTHCALCQSAFWTARRKHHCRSCGKIFCGDCSNYYSPVPNQHIKENARVCKECFEKLQSTKQFIEDPCQPQMVAE